MNEKQYLEVNVEDFVQRLDDIWWGERYKRIEELKSDTGFDYLESVPQDLRNHLMTSYMASIGSGESRKSDDSSNIIDFKESRSTSGKGASYRIRCSDKHYSKVKKLDKRMYEDCKDFVFTISEVPNGTSLKRSHNTHYYKKLTGQTKDNLRSVYGIHQSYDSYQYRIGNNYRILWFVDDDNKRCVIFEFCTAHHIHNKMGYSKGK